MNLVYIYKKDGSINSTDAVFHEGEIKLPFAEDIEKVDALKILSSSKDTGVYAVTTKNGRQIFITGHSEYDPDTLKNEYLRDLSQGKPIEIPVRYFPSDDPSQPPLVTWRAHAHLLFSNWLNYFVYQSTPYDIGQVPTQK